MKNTVLETKHSPWHVIALEKRNIQPLKHSKKTVSRTPKLCCRQELPHYSILPLVGKSQCPVILLFSWSINASTSIEQQLYHINPSMLRGEF